jgi:hypothetical protein
MQVYETILLSDFLMNICIPEPQIPWCSSPTLAAYFKNPSYLLV